MATTYVSGRRQGFGPWAKDKLLMGQTWGGYFRSLLTPFNLIVLLILWIGIPLAVVRFSQGLASTTNLSNTNPWGLWIGFDVLSGVGLAAGGYVMATAVHVFKLKAYQPVVRAAVLTGFLGYFFVVIGLLFDLGRAWRLPYPIFVQWGVTSVMFLVAWHVLLYLTCQFVEFSPAVFEWLGWNRLRKLALGWAVGATVVGVILSTLHQSALGALFLLAPGKLHPLWYSPLIPIFFFVSSIVAGMCMVIVEGALSHRAFGWQIGADHHEQLDKITIGLGRAAALVLFPYFGLKMVGVMHSNAWNLLGTPLGNWFLVEIIGFVLLPVFLFLFGARAKNVRLIRFTALWTVIGIVINRLNVSVIAFNWDVADRYVPRWSEIIVTLMIVTLLVISFRWVVNRMPVLRPHPDYKEDDH